jgi:hypothetical protein
MLDILGLAVASVFLVLGGVLLYDGFSKPDATQTLMIVGAVLMSLATVILTTRKLNRYWKKTTRQESQTWPGNFGPRFIRNGLSNVQRIFWN